ncbi:MAG TPA: zf-HC2 domain-containing protein [Steroidobacteraceae bacterium]|nr:zf-HC2 domain-containing protein [Steroidobacteraceae bacterium]
MMRRDALSSREHRESWDLLPWLANQRLTEAQTQQVEKHLQQCEACRTELEEQRRLRDAIRAEEAVVLAPQTSFNKLMQRIDSEADTEFDSEVPTRTAVVARTQRMPKWLAIAASIQVMAVAALLGSLWWQQREVQVAPRFATLTAPNSTAKGPVLRVVFDDQTKLADISTLLKSIDARVVAGPTDAGVFTLMLNSKASSADALKSAVVQLRQDTHVVFCEPAVLESERQ